MAETTNKLQVMLDDILSKINYLGGTQMLIIEKLSSLDKNFRLEFIAHTLAYDEIRNGFTDFLEETGAPDAMKLMMMEMNEMAIKIKKQVMKEEE